MQWNLIKLRKEAKLTQKDMAKMIGISEESYGMKERGQKQFKADEMFILSKYFGLPIEKIFLPRNFSDNEVKKAN